MKIAFRRIPSVTMAAVMAAAICSPASAEDAPRRKSGLWEMKTSMAGMPAGMGAMQVCVDEKSDDMTQSQARAEAQKMCSRNDVKRDGDRWSIHSVCKMEKVTATTDAVFTGRLDSGYKGDIRTTYEPPMMGRGETHMTIEAKWLGPCKPGQRPGDVTMNGMTMNPGMMRGKPGR